MGCYGLVAEFLSWILARCFPSKQMLDADAVTREWSASDHGMTDAEVRAWLGKPAVTKVIGRGDFYGPLKENGDGTYSVDFGSRDDPASAQRFTAAQIVSVRPM